MEKLKFHIVYKNLIKFFDDYNIDLDCQFVLSVSGGKDSMVLYYLFNDLYSSGKIPKFRVIHFNHQSRQESDSESKFVKNICIKDRIDCEVANLGLGSNLKNFESVAREARYSFIEENLKGDEICCFGHHLNDHFEWSLMRFFRSGENDFLKGMPCYRHPLCRPLSYSSVEEIIDFCKQFKVQYVEDLSNFDNFADRNYVRNNLVPTISNRFPNYLNFFLDRMKYFNDCDATEAKSHFNKTIYNIELVKSREDMSIYHSSHLEISDLEAIKNVIKNFQY